MVNPKGHLSWPQSVSFLFCKNIVIGEFVLRLNGERPGNYVFQVSRRAGYTHQEINRHLECVEESVHSV